MKIALVGYGKMGKRIDTLASERGHEIVARIDTKNRSQLNELSGTDLAIEFTQPDAATDNFERLLEQGIPVVTGTTGWYDRLDEIRAKCESLGGRFFHASNFSPGVFITHHLTAELARIMNDFPYSAEIEEWHHAEKKDAPSGTAETLAHEIITHHKTYSGYGLKARNSNTLPVQSHREGDIKGIHAVRFTSDVDQIELKHEAFSRDGFALGAVMAAEFLLEQAPGVYSMQNLIRL